MKSLRVLLLVGAAWFSPMTALAEQDVASQRATEFQAMEGARAEDAIPGGNLMIAAYGVVMLLLVGYIARLGMLQRRTSSDVARLSELIARSQSKS